MNSAIAHILNEYGASFMEKIAEKYSLPLEDLQEMWKENMKVKHSKVKKTAAANKKPRKPTAYILFCKEQRPLLPSGMAFTDISRELGRLWAEADKQKYRDLANADQDVPPPPPVVVAPPVEEEEESPVLVSTMTQQEDASQTQTQTQDDITTAPKKPKNKRPTRTAVPTIPENLTEREAELWAQLAGRDDLREQCKARGIKPIPRNKDDIVRAIVQHQINLESVDNETEDEEDEPL